MKLTSKLFFAFTTAAVLAACGNSQNPNEESNHSGVQPAAAQIGTGTLHEACKAYLDRRATCFAKKDKKRLAEHKAEYGNIVRSFSSLPADEQVRQCMSANQSFDDIAKELKCE